VVVSCLVGSAVLPVHAQQALEASGAGIAPALRGGTILRSELPPSAMLILRPQPSLKALADEVAAVLELRTGQRVEVGDPPPPGLLEAVPAGHVALAEHEGAVLLVLGAPGGRSFDARVEIEALADASAARAVALAAEDLRDTAIELARVDGSPAPASEALDEPAPEPVSESDEAERPAHALDAMNPPRDDGEGARAEEGRGFLGDIDPLLYVRIYGGASTASESIASGLGTGLGLCVLGHCLFVAGELPLVSERGEELDVRYRYTTFLSGFYSRPFTFSGFTPGASLAFLTRLGNFEADMGGRKSAGIDNDLGARGSLELSYEMFRGLDLMSEGGVDFTIDRDHVQSGERVVARGDRWSPWAQAAVRFRP
jgi:hypothetical protein